MIKSSFKSYYELCNRSCDALVLAYSPTEVLAKDCERNFYIPSQNDVEEAFGFSLRKIFGEINGTNHWADSVKWGSVANLNKLEKRIKQGVGEIICGDKDYQTTFEGYLSSMWGNFNSTWVYLKGSLYGFREGKREIALEKFDKYWNKKEKSRWNEIHNFMREYTAEEFRKKNRR